MENGTVNDSLTKYTTQEASYTTSLAAAQGVLAAILTVINVATVTGSIFIMISVFINRKLQNTTSIFLINLAVADLSLGLFVMPFSVFQQIAKQWVFGKLYCNLWAAADVMSCTASIWSLCAISIDRYIGVTEPLRHKVIKY